MTIDDQYIQIVIVVAHAVCTRVVPQLLRYGNLQPDGDQVSEPVELSIKAMGVRGEGVAELSGAPVYVSGVLPGETVRALIEGSHAVMTECLNPSPERVTPPCKHFGHCGGCQLQHWAPDAYRAWKRDLVVIALAHQGLEVPVNDLVAAYGDGRRRATLHATHEKAGFMSRRSHEIVALDHCPILVPALADAPALAVAIARLAGPCDIAFTATDTGLDIALPARTRITDRAALANLAHKNDIARISAGNEILIQRRVPQLTFGKATVALPPQSFLQATRAAEEVLAGLVNDHLGKAKKVADLFSGLGPFALRVAERAQIFAADSNAAAIAACDTALQATPGLKRIGTEVRDLFRDPYVTEELKKFDAVILDPPRAGAEAQCRELARSSVKTIISVSCDPRTFARDARILVDGGYKMGPVTPVDQFRYAAHVELVAAFRR